MENYSLELYSADKATRQAFLTHHLLEAERTEEIGGNFYLELLLNPYIPNGGSCFEVANWYSQLAEKKTVKVIRKSDSSYEFFIIQKITREKSAGKQFLVRLYCEHYKFRLLELITQLFAKEYASINATTALNLIKDHTGDGSEFTIGSVDIPTDEYKDLKFDVDNAYDLIKLIAQSWEYADGSEKKPYTVKISSGLQVDLLTEANYGSDVDQPVKFGKNAKGIVKLSDVSKLANRIFPEGKDGADMNSAGLLYKEGLASGWKYTGMTYTGDLSVGTAQRCCPKTYVFVKMKRGYATDVVSSPADMVYDFKLELLDSSSVVLNNKIIVETKTPSTNPPIEFLLLEVLDQVDVKSIKITMDSATNWDKGTATGGSTTTLQDTSKSWTVNEHAGKKVYNESTAEEATISSNTSDTLIVSTWTAPQAGHSYYINAKDPAVSIQECCWFLADNKLYVEDATSQSSYGIVEQPIKNNDINHCVNVIRNPIMANDQTYWNATGGATVTVNTDADYVYHGTQSLKVVTATGMQGIDQVFQFGADIPYVAYIRLYIESGQVKIYILDGDGTTVIAEHITQGLGWTEILIENFTAITSHYDLYSAIHIKSWDVAGDVGATFYVDAVMIALDQTKFERFYATSSGDILKEKAQTYLNLHKDPKTSYEVDLFDLYEQDPTTWDEDKFGVGDRVKVYDVEMGIDTTLLVTKKTTNLLKPTDCQVEIARAPKRMTDILKDFKDKDTDKKFL